MEADAEKQDGLIDAAGDLMETYRELITTRIVEHTSLGAAISVVGILTMLISVFILLFTGIGAAWWIGDTLNDMKAGFFIVGGFYCLILVVVLALAKPTIIPSFRDSIIKKIYEQD